MFYIPENKIQWRVLVNTVFSNDISDFIKGINLLNKRTTTSCSTKLSLLKFNPLKSRFGVNFVKSNV
jgi:hypothetical protein